MNFEINWGSLLLRIFCNTFIYLPNFISIDLSYVLWWYCYSCYLKSNYLGKLIHYNHNYIFVIWFEKWFNNVNTDFLLWFFKYFQWMKSLCLFYILHFILQTVICKSTCLEITFPQWNHLQIIQVHLPQ